MFYGDVHKSLATLSHSCHEHVSKISMLALREFMFALCSDGGISEICPQQNPESPENCHAHTQKILGAGRKPLYAN